MEPLRPHPDSSADALLARLDHLDVPPIDLLTSWHTLSARLDVSPHRRYPPQVRIATQTSWIPRVVAIAMVAMLMIGSVVTWRHFNPAIRTQEYVGTDAFAPVTLFDHSSVTLSPGSTLRFTMQSNGARVARLRGQAYFAVAPDRRRPFIVETSTISARVLGTVFGVRQAPTGAAIVEVLEGKVAVGRRGVPGTPLVLVAGRGVRMENGENRAYVVPYDTTMWTQGFLNFENAPVSVVLDALGRWYGYQFQLADSTLATRHVTTTFRINSPVETMAMLKNLLNVRMQVDGGIITLYEKNRGEADSVMQRSWRTHIIPSEVGK